jgi:triosephosphate isomerase (TIM)
MGMRPLVAGNWKMNGLASSLKQLEAVAASLTASPAGCEVLVCPPFTLIAAAAGAVQGALALGGQDCHAQPAGAHTGDIAAEMLKDAGASYVILGHSERRQNHGERNADVALKVQAAWRAGLSAIICIGETEIERFSGDAHDVCATQINGSVPAVATAANTVIAYEPVWAIGTGRTPTSKEITQMHTHIRGNLVRRLGAGAAQMRILYGGSVKPENAADILNLPEVNGALVGGASIKSDDFLLIIRAFKAA